MTYEYIRMSYRWIRVYTSDIRITFEYIELTFLKLFINSLSKYLVWIKIPWMQWLFCFSLITKLKRGLELAFGEHFLHGSLYECSLFNTHQLTKFQCHIFFTSQDLKQNVLLILILSIDGVKGEGMRERQKCKNLSISKAKTIF